MDECINSIIRRLPFTSNDYLLTSYVGKGNYSVVFQAISPRYNDKHFAAKVSALDPCLLSEDGLHEAELEALTQLIHPNIIKVYDYVITTTSNLLYESYKNRQGTESEPPSDEEILDLINTETPGLLDQETYYLVLILDFCENGTLEEMFGIKQDHELGNNLSPSSNFNFGVNSFENSLNLFSNIVDALSYCHSKGISHGDLKPSNIFVNQYNRAIVADFGLASFYTNSIDIMRGTPYYCAPEIFLEGMSYDPFLADIFALGVTAYQFFTGTLPFTEDQLRNGTIDEVEIKVVFPGHEKDYERYTKKNKKMLFSLTLESPGSAGSPKADLSSLNHAKNTIHTSRATDDFKLYTYRSTVNQNSDQPPKQVSLAPTLAATTAINHPTNPNARIKKRRAVLPDIACDQNSNENPVLITSHRSNESTPHTPLVDHKSLVKPKVSTPTYQAPRVSSFFFGNPKGRSLANFFDKDNPEEEEEDEYHGFTSIGEIKKEKARLDVRMSLAELIRKMLTKNPEERPLMAEINYKTKSLISQYYSIDNKNIGHVPSINRVFSATTSVTNFLLAARSKAAKEKSIQEQACSTSRDASPLNEKSPVFTNHNAKPLDGAQQQLENHLQKEPFSQQDVNYQTDSPQKMDSEYSNQLDANQEKNLNDIDAIYAAKPRDRTQSSLQPNSLSSRPPKLNKAAQLLPIIKQPTSRSRSSRRSMKVSSVNLSVFTTKITQKTNNILSQPNYYLARKGSAGSFEHLRNFSDSEANAELYAQPVNLANANK